MINLKDIFKIDFDNHQSYIGTKVSYFDIAINNVKFFTSSLVSIFWILILSRNYRDNLSNDSHNILSDGVLGIKNNDLAFFLKNVLKNKINNIEKDLQKISINERRIQHCINSVNKRDNKKLYDSIEEKVLGIHEINDALLNFFNKKPANLVHFNIHINDENDNFVFKHDEHDFFDDEMNFFHVDTNLNTLKIMIYLNDVNSQEEGAFEYVLGSKELFTMKEFFIRRVLRKIGAYKRDERGKKMILSLPKSLRIKNEFSDYSKDSLLGKYIRSKSKLFLAKQNVIIFDPLGIHRGGRVKKGKRTAIQLVFCTDNFSWQIK